MSWPVVVSRRNLSALAMAIVVGVLHRAAETTPWADDRLMAADPSWVQWSAPYWHSSLERSGSVSSVLTRLIDPMTSASTAGDARGIAAVIASLAAWVLLSTFSRLGVRAPAVFPLCVLLAAPVLPTSSATAIAHAIQRLAAAAMLLVWCAPAEWVWRLPLLAVLTLAGTVNHVGFAAFAAGFWMAECIFPRRQSHLVTMAIALVVLF